MIVLVVVGVSLALVPILGGRPGALLDLRLRSPWLVLVALAGQLALALVPGADPWRPGAHVATFAIGLAFVWRNRSVRGLWLVALGAAANGAAIAANGGVMPASASALRTAGLDPAPVLFANSRLVADPVLAFLGDVFAIPASWPFANVFSVGDVLVALGAAYAVHAACGSRAVPRRWRLSPAAPSPPGR